MKNKKVSFVIPCYNEEDNIFLLFEEINSVFRNENYRTELIFVNDGSNDNTTEVLNNLLNIDFPEIKVIDFSRNFGKEAAIYAGLQHSTGDFISLIDADLQQPPRLVLEMVKILESSPELDCVAAYQSVRNESFVKKVSKNCFYRIVNKVSYVHFTDSASDFRTFRRNMAEALVSLGEKVRFTKGIFSWIGFKTEYIPYVASQRNAGVTKWSFFKLLKYSFDGIFSFSTSLLSAPMFLGYASLLSALIMLIVGIVKKFVFSLSLSSNFAVILLLLFISGFMFLSIGLLGEYITRMFVEIKNRPIYIAKSVCTNKKGD